MIRTLQKSDFDNLRMLRCEVRAIRLCKSRLGVGLDLKPARGAQVHYTMAQALRLRAADHCTSTNEKFQESDVGLKRDGNWQLARKHYSDVPAPATRRP